MRHWLYYRFRENSGLRTHHRLAKRTRKHYRKIIEPIMKSIVQINQRRFTEWPTLEEQYQATGERRPD